jgi:hypothetical protein
MVRVPSRLLSCMPVEERWYADIHEIGYSTVSLSKIQLEYIPATDFRNS